MDEHKEGNTGKKERAFEKDGEEETEKKDEYLGPWIQPVKKGVSIFIEEDGHALFLFRQLAISSIDSAVNPIRVLNAAIRGG